MPIKWITSHIKPHQSTAQTIIKKEGLSFTKSLIVIDTCLPEYEIEIFKSPGNKISPVFSYYKKIKQYK